MQLIILQTLIIKILRKFTENVQKRKRIKKSFLEEKIKANHVQNEAAKISVLSSKNLLDKYEYLTGEDLGYKQNVFEKLKFEYSPLGMVLTNNTKSKTNRNTVIRKKKRQIFNLQFTG